MNNVTHFLSPRVTSSRVPRQAASGAYQHKALPQQNPQGYSPRPTHHMTAYAEQQDDIIGEKATLNLGTLVFKVSSNGERIHFL